LKSRDVTPEVIVADRDNILINVVERVFSKFIALLHQYHISKKKKIKKKYKKI